MKIKLNKLTLSQFRAADGEIHFGKHTELSGANKVGKTTRYNALLWLLTGYDNNDSLNHKLFNTMLEPTPDNAVQCAVEGEFEIDGTKTVIKRTADIKWVTKRKSKEKERGGTDDYHVYIDGIEYTAKEYKEYLSENIADQRLLRIMLNGYSFLKEDWKTQRKLLVDLFEDEINEALKDKHKEAIADIKKIGKGKQEILVKHISTEKAEAKKTIDSMDSKIEEINNQMEVVDETLATKITAKEELKKSKEEELQGLNATTQLFGGDLAKLREDYSNANKVYNEAFDNERDEKQAEYDKLKRDYQDKLDEYDGKVRLYKKEAQAISDKEEELAELNKEREKNKADYKEIVAKVFVDEYCPTCNQKLTPEQITEAKAKFETDKEAKKVEILNKGSKDKKAYQDLEAEIKSLKEAHVEPAKPTEPSKMADLKKELDKERTPFSETEKGKEFMAQAEQLKADSKPDNSKEIEAKKKTLSGEIETLANELIELKAQNGAVERNKTRNDDIAARQTSKTEAMQRRADAECLEDRLKAYDSEKATLMQSKMNDVFEFCHVILRKQMKDGTWNDTCELEYDGEYSVLNDGGRIIAAIDVQKAFQKLKGVTLPLFVDRAESLTTKFTHEGQIVTLRTTNDKYLQTKIIE